MHAALTARDPIPASLGAWDRMVEAARQQNQENREHEAERAALIEQNVADLEKILASGDLRAPVFFAKRRSPIKAPALKDLLWEAVEESHELPGKLLSLLFFASEGMDCTDLAKELRKAVIQTAAEAEVA